jgi:2-keto-4-pentenoate hydratase/2-oxohepta-3-ene-1,7-dioic acid hydratase in catechol pathway
MKFISYSINGRHSFGVAKDDGIVDLGKQSDLDLHGVLRQNVLHEMMNLAADMEPDVSFDEIVYERTINYPEKIICIGVNYSNRNEEYKDVSSAPKYPSVFMRTPDSLTGHQQPIMDPPESDQLDYEGEIVIVIGKEGRRIKEEDAYSYIAGLTLMNEGSIRDWLRHAKFNVTQGKNFVASGSLGPWMVTADEFTDSDYDDMVVRTHVNGELRQDDTTENLIFSFKYLISYVSQFYLLKPGDIIATGTPNGAGARFDPPKYLRQDDVVKVSVDKIGTLSNKVETEQV